MLGPYQGRTLLLSKRPHDPQRISVIDNGWMELPVNSRGLSDVTRCIISSQGNGWPSKTTLQCINVEQGWEGRPTEALFARLMTLMMLFWNVNIWMKSTSSHLNADIWCQTIKSTAWAVTAIMGVHNDPKAMMITIENINNHGTQAKIKL